MTDGIINNKEVADIMMDYYYLHPEMVPPHKLYRYRPTRKYYIKEIEESIIFLSQVEKLNDPFDSSYVVSFKEALLEKCPGQYFFAKCWYLRDYPWYDSLSATIKNSGIFKEEITMHDFFSFLVNEIKKAGYRASVEEFEKFYYEKDPRIRQQHGYTASFSEKNDSITMWSYYANDHKGVCLGYDLKQLDLSQSHNNLVYNSIKKVWYSTLRAYDREGKYSPFVKSQEWSHEHEWRLYNDFKGGVIAFPCLTEVYLGINFSMRNFSMIKRALIKNPNC